MIGKYVYVKMTEALKTASNQEEVYGYLEENKEALEFILDYAKNDGFKVFNDDNYAGHIEFGQGEDLFPLLYILPLL